MYYGQIPKGQSMYDVVLPIWSILRKSGCITEPKTELKDSKTYETIIFKKNIQESHKEPPVIEVPNLVELQKAKTTENLVKHKELGLHRYLQTRIKKMAETRGYKASIEEPTPDGQGRIDVLLERGKTRIACEIGVTTTKEWETHNIEKCLNAGYEIVIAVPIDNKAAEIMKKQLSEKLTANFQLQVFVMNDDELFLYLDKKLANGQSKTILKIMNISAIKH